VAKKFIDELKIFHAEEAAAQQYFFAYVTVGEMAAADSELLKLIHLHPWFWTSAHHAMLLATFVALGRIFDPGSPHNIGTLMKAVSADTREFSCDALKDRLIEKGLSPEEAAEHAGHAHELTKTEVRELKKKVECWRRVYEANYDAIRNKVFAHKELSSAQEIDVLFAKTSVDELKKLFKFLSSLRLALWAAYENGVAANLECYDQDMFVGERVRREGEKILKLMLEGSRFAQ
jgi:hypothetical protein